MTISTQKPFSSNKIHPPQDLFHIKIMQYLPTRILTLLLLTVTLISCTHVPITGRSQLNLISDNEIFSLSRQQYAEVLKNNRVISTGPQAQMVQRTGRNIQRAVELYFKNHQMSKALAGYQWEFHLVDSKQKNAFCMPGGKVVIYSGILETTRDETGLAVVMGHEIAHAVANHGNERMSQNILTQLGGASLAVALKEEPHETRQLAMLAFGVGTQVGVLLPYSRLHESEADHLGLIFMAMAGYDPREAPLFWQRMASGQQGQVPELLSTHPADHTRIRDLQRLIPEALRYYKPIDTNNAT